MRSPVNPGRLPGCGVAQILEHAAFVESRLARVGRLRRLFGERTLSEEELGHERVEAVGSEQSCEVLVEARPCPENVTHNHHRGPSRVAERCGEERGHGLAAEGNQHLAGFDVEACGLGGVVRMAHAGVIVANVS
jgi:hypothetical protein